MRPRNPDQFPGDQCVQSSCAWLSRGEACSGGGVPTARSNWSASSTVTLPCASRSRMRRVSSLMFFSFSARGSARALAFLTLQPCEHVGHRHLAALEADVLARLKGEKGE